MRRPRSVRRACQGAESGAAAVEFALLFPIFIVLAIGTISAGFAFHTWLSVTHAAQESSRFAATLSVEAAGGSTTAWLNQVAQRALAAGDFGDATAALPGTSVCVALHSPTNIPPSPASHLVLTADGSGALTPVAGSGGCPGMTTPSGEYVQVSVTRPTGFNFVVGSTLLDINGRSSSRFEAVALS